MLRACFLFVAALLSLAAGGPSSGEGQTIQVPGNGTGYDEGEALLHAYLATASYCGYPHLPGNQGLEKWDCGPACDHVQGVQDVRIIQAPGGRFDAYAFVAKLGGQCILVFRGTIDWDGMTQDLKAVHLVDFPNCSYANATCRVGYGFWQSYNAVSDYIIGNLSASGCNRPPFSYAGLVVTGHSLGAAIASMAMYDLVHKAGYRIVKANTFGQPRVGDETFARAFNETFPVGVYRITHSTDPVVHLPYGYLGFQHHATEVFYPGDMSTGFRICKGYEDPSCASQYDKMFDFIDIVFSCLENETSCAHLTYMSRAKEIGMDSSSCLLAPHNVSEILI